MIRRRLAYFASLLILAVSCSAPKGVPYFRDIESPDARVEGSKSSEGTTVPVIAETPGPKVSVLGEVARPGRYAIDREVFTILDAIGEAGDLTIWGRRDRVKVIRRLPDGGVHTYLLDLGSASEVVTSPAYVLQDNDIVYVEPNRMRTRQTTVNGNSLVSLPFWVSVASLIVTVLFWSSGR